MWNNPSHPVLQQIEQLQPVHNENGKAIGHHDPVGPRGVRGPASGEEYKPEPSLPAAIKEKADLIDRYRHAKNIYLERAKNCDQAIISLVSELNRDDLQFDLKKFLFEKYELVDLVKITYLADIDTTYETVRLLKKISDMVPIHFTGNAIQAFLAVMDLHNKRAKLASSDDIAFAERVMAAAFVKLEAGEKNRV